MTVHSNTAEEKRSLQINTTITLHLKNMSSTFKQVIYKFIFGITHIPFIHACTYTHTHTFSLSLTHTHVYFTYESLHMSIL